MACDVPWLGKKIASITKNKGEKNIRVTLETAITEMKISLKKNKVGYRSRRGREHGPILYVEF